jgi:hypothetical protein
MSFKHGGADAGVFVLFVYHVGPGVHLQQPKANPALAEQPACRLS